MKKHNRKIICKVIKMKPFLTLNREKKTNAWAAGTIFAQFKTHVRIDRMSKDRMYYEPQKLTNWIAQNERQSELKRKRKAIHTEIERNQNWLIDAALDSMLDSVSETMDDPKKAHVQTFACESLYS